MRLFEVCAMPPELSRMTPPSVTGVAVAVGTLTAAVGYMPQTSEIDLPATLVQAAPSQYRTAVSLAHMARVVAPSITSLALPSRVTNLVNPAAMRKPMNLPALPETAGSVTV
ncbi:hypothetical protein D3C84_540220 [compost metagenome]